MKMKEIHKQELMERMAQNIIAQLKTFDPISNFLYDTGVSHTNELHSNLGTKGYIMDRLSRTPTEKLLKIVQNELGLDISDLLE